MNKRRDYIQDKMGIQLRNSTLGIIIELSLFLIVLVLWTILSLPSTVIPFFLLACLSLWLRQENWSHLGLTNPDSWFTAIAIGVGIGGIIVAFTKLGLPILYDILGKEYQPVGLYMLEGNLPKYLALLVGTWILAALMEEMVFRGYILNRLLGLLGESKKGIGIALVLSATIFAYAHGTLETLFLSLTFLQGLLLGIVYLCARKNLWFSIIAHGTGITANITLALFGVF